MSYILDALKKSESERRSRTAPALLSDQDARVHVPHRRSIWPYLLLAALLLNAAIITWWLIPPQVKKSSVPARSLMKERQDMVGSAVPATGPNDTEKDIKTVPRKPKPEVRSGVIPISAMREPEPARQESSASGQSRAAGPAVSAIHPQEPDRSQNPPAPESRPEINNAPLAVSPPHLEEPGHPGNKIYSLFELPPALQQDLPPLSISAHIHSGDRSSRLVKIDGRMMKEGQELSAGLKVEEITPDGAILSYHNYLFSIGLK